MERYSTAQADLVTEWGVETGLEEPMWGLGLGGGPDSYPERPDEPACIYYLRTGFCGYGNRCRFDHPRDRSAAMGAIRASGGEFPERIGQPVCQYYMRTGMCKFGASCKYDHPKHGVGSSAPISINVYGYPLRPGEKECSYYIKTGQCKFGVTCKFHHPQPAGIQVPPIPAHAPAVGPGPLAGPPAMPTPALYQAMQSPSVQSSQQYGVIPGNWPVPRPTMLPGSYVPGSYGPMLLPPGVVPIPGWTPYPAQVSPVASPSAQHNVGAGPVYGMTQLPPSSTGYTGPFLPSTSAGPYLPSTSAGPSSSSQNERAFPERPGQPECQYYLRTGDCKFGPTCKYHHPPEWKMQNTTFSLSPLGLPLRPGAPLCSHYAQNGVCRFGPSCKFDHPMRILSYSSSSSSLSDMPVAPYPIGSTNTTLAPSSSSSSNLRPELFSSNLSVMTNTSSSVGSTFSMSAPVPQFSVQRSGQGSTSSSGGSSSSHGVEARISS